MTGSIRREVKAALHRNPKADSTWVQAAVAARVPEAAELSVRSFHARYVLPVKRQRNGSTGRRQVTDDPDLREKVRSILRADMLMLIRRSVEAEHGALVDLVARVDERADTLAEDILRSITDSKLTQA